MESQLRQADTRRFRNAAKIISTMTEEQARFALLLTNKDLRGYLMIPHRQKEFIANLKRALKAR